MIRLTLTQIQQIEQDAILVLSSEAAKDALPKGAVIDAWAGRSAIPVQVPREIVVAQINASRDSALARLKALGIDFDPAG